MTEGLCEFPPNGIILNNFPTELIILRDWKVTNVISDPVSGNSRKCWLETLPCFDYDKCPFLIASGNLTYNIVNLKTATMQILIQEAVPNWFGAQAWCFTKRYNKIEMHFCTRNFNGKG